MCEKLGDKNSTETIRTGNILLLYASNNNIRLGSSRTKTFTIYHLLL